MMFRLLLSSLPLLFTFSLLAQRKDNPYSQDLHWRNIGPANMMGRISAVEALETDYRHVLCATASGGVMKSTNGGITWESVFDRYGAGSIGAIAMMQSNPDIIWVGTGEAANRNSSGWGDGIYRSADGGKTFAHLGLENTHHIAEIALHPEDPNIAFVAAVGHLWGYSGDRGLFKTVDGGRSWEKLMTGLPNDGKTGCTEIIMQPGNPNVLFAGFYQRLREPYWYTSGGPNGGIYKSVNGGKTWRKIRKGLPTGDTGMIDLSICRKFPDIMVAAVEADENLPEGLPGSGVYRSDNGGESWRFLHKHAVRPFYHGQIEIDPINPDNIYIVSHGAEISRDGGQSFQARKWRADGGDDHDMWIAPYDNDIIYLCTDQGLRLTVDGGQSILSFNNMAIAQYYAIGTDMRDPYWVAGGLQDNGLWAGPSNSREFRGILNMHNTWVGEGDGFHTQIDPTDWRTMYLVNHVGFCARLNVETREHTYITPTPETIVNFDEYFDPDFPETKTNYTIYPGEHWFFFERAGRPILPPQFRFNWSSPLVLSPNNPRTIYFGGNYLFKSVDRGESWRIISPDLTGNDPQWRNPSKSGYLTNSVTGGENHFNIITIAESALNDALIWVGTDDGYVHVSRNGGATWTEVGNQLTGLNPRPWISRVEPSNFVEGRCYVTLDNHRYDDMKPYVFVTEDFGQTWTDITGDLPEKYSTYVLHEDLENPNLLFVGTEAAVHFSIDRGKSWHELMAKMPTVAIHDLIVHPREGDLIAGTHGRSIWILDDIGPLRQSNSDVLEKQIHIYQSKVATKWRQINTGRKQPYFEFRGANPHRGAAIQFYLKETPKDSVTISVIDPYSARNRMWKVAADKGINRHYWDFFFLPSKEDLKLQKSNLQKTIELLDARVQQPVLKDTLSAIRVDCRAINTVRSANKVRSRLVESFAGYAGGRPLFAKPLKPIEAPAGRYRIRVLLNDREAEGWITIREDPLLAP